VDSPLVLRSEPPSAQRANLRAAAPHSYLHLFSHAYLSPN